MIASQPLFPSLAWSFESPDQHHNYPSNNYFSATHHHETFVLAESNNDHYASTSPDQATPDVNGHKKLHHNASERDRRKKMNTLYSSLRYLLPAADQMKKLSIPSTVARVVKYIPELQQEVHNLITKKEKLMSKMANHENLKIHRQNQPKQTNHVSSLNRLENGDVVIQIPAQKGKDCPLMSELLLNLEEDHGLLPLSVSSFESSGATLLFYNLHFQVKQDYKIGSDAFNEKLNSLLQKKEMVFPRDLCIMQNKTQIVYR